MFNKRLVGMVPSSMKMVGLTVLVQWLGLCCNIAVILAAVQFLNRLLAGRAPGGAAAVLGLVAVLAIAARFWCFMAASRLSFRASEKVKLHLREAIYAKLLRLGPSYHQQVSTSEVVQVAVDGVDQLEVYFGRYLPQLFYSVAASFTLFGVLAGINLPAALVLLACVPLIPLSIIAVQRFAKKLLAKYWGKYTSLGDGFLENLQGLTTLKIYGSDEAKNAEMNHRAEDFRKVTMRVLIMQLNSVTLMDLVAYGGAAAGIIVAARQFAAGHTGFAGSLAIVLLAADFFIPLRQLGSFFHVAMNGMAASDKIFKLLGQPEPDAGTATVVQPQKGLLLENVTFGYGHGRPVLQNVSLKAQGGLTAIVGESGSGKSTIAALFTGQNKGYEGTVQVGGQPLAQLAGEVLCKTVTLVTHSSYLFKGTVRQNLLMANPKATEEEMWQALGRVKLLGFLQAQQGLNTPLAEQGGNLSGGQRQRLALARAILHDTPMYIFDEATSNIDSESEAHIAAAIWEMAKTKTVLLISHRLANVVPAAGIYVLEKGVVVQQGTHARLLAQNGPYAKMFNTQQALEQVGQKEAHHAKQQP
ncbi:MAG: ABC transporter ATP-binding protein/permease [Oscillospiraceae bacterium]